MKPEHKFNYESEYEKYALKESKSYFTGQIVAVIVIVLLIVTFI